MNKGLMFVAGLAVGAGIGATVGYFVGKRKVEARIDEEIASVKEAFRQKYEEESVKEDEQKEDIVRKPILEKPPIEDLVKYTNVTAQYRSDEEKSRETKVIAPADFGLYENYAQISLLYTEDGYLLDTDEEPLEDPESYIGMTAHDAASHFGEYEDDSVYIINEETETYYEILLTNKRYNMESDEDMSPEE